MAYHHILGNVLGAQVLNSHSLEGDSTQPRQFTHHPLGILVLFGFRKPQWVVRSKASLRPLPFFYVQTPIQLDGTDSLHPLRRMKLG
jgi:hypothetical protein